MKKKNLFAAASLLIVLSMLLATCGATPEPQIIEKVVEKTVVETVVVAGTPEIVEKVVTEVVEVEVEKEVEVVVTATSAPPVTLEIMATQPEYENAERQIWAIWEAKTGNTVNLYSVNEDQDDAYQAKLAGGYVPAMSRRWTITPANMDNYVNLLETDFKWFDRWQYDVRHAWENKYGEPGVFSLDPYQGFIFTWHYHKDLMDELGLDPRSVKTFEDLKEFIAEGTAAVEANPDIDYFWDQGWHGWVFAQNLWGLIPLAYPDGQREMQVASWRGEITDPAQDPFRHTLNFYKEACEKGWVPDEFWLREWETDMEASYIAKKSVMVLHGPWLWDKMLAADPTAVQEGIPATPPSAEAGQTEWMQGMGPLRIETEFHMPIGNLDKPEYDVVMDAWNFWFSPETIKMRAELEGRAVMYDTDEPVVLEGPQWEGVTQEFEAGGLYENVKIETGLTGDEAMARYKVEDSGNLWEWQWAELYSDICTGAKTVDEGLAWFHEQVAKDYPQP